MDQIKKRFFLPEKFELALNCKNVKEPPVRYLVSAEHSVVRNETLFLVLRHIIIWIAKSVRYHFCSSDDRGFFFLIGFFFFSCVILPLKVGFHELVLKFQHYVSMYWYLCSEYVARSWRIPAVPGKKKKRRQNVGCGDLNHNCLRRELFPLSVAA